MNAFANAWQTGAELDHAVSEWSALLGQEHVIVGQAELRDAETATFQTAQRVPAIVRPGNRDEVREVLRIANRRRVPVYPVSGGRNWGYGSKVPAADGCVLLDLARMNRILDFSEDLAYVTVEPGVTQGQLYEFLRGRKSGLWMDATGSSPGASMIGNTIERGFGHTPYGDHFAYVCGMEVVLPTGEIVETGFSRFRRARTGGLHRWGVGPYVDGLFTQSNLGVVTRMSFWLMPAPEYFQAYFFRADREESLPALIDALRPLRLDGTIRSAVHIANDYKVLSGLQQYPWDETSGRTPLGPLLMSGLRRRLHFGAWNGSGGLYGTRVQVREARRLVRRALKAKADKLQFLDDRALELAGRFAGIYRFFTGWDLSRALDLVRPVYGLMRGVPTDQPLASAYWRKRTPPPVHMDPDRDGCGLLWYSPVAPAAGRHARELTGLAGDILLAHGFEPAISLTMISERSLACVISISYDRAVAGEDRKAAECYEDLVRQLSSRGFYSYRLGIQSMAAIRQAGGYERLVRSIKAAVDPNRVLAPGRYEPFPS
jgi:4-cresol dehydrogenase (hydroxylating)